MPSPPLIGVAGSIVVGGWNSDSSPESGERLRCARTAPRRWRQTFSTDGERAWPLRREYAALAAILVLSGLLEFVKLAQNGYANVYYSAAVKSMLRSFHNFFYLAADPNGLITVDKPPLGLWLQAISAKIFVARSFSKPRSIAPSTNCLRPWAMTSVFFFLE